jgi:peptide/nickel transport system permease protein
MGLYILKRLILLIPILLGVTLLTFMISKITPGDPVQLMLGIYATPESISALRETLGLNDPMFVQYTRFVWNALQGDLGYSIRSQEPVLSEIVKRFPNTLELTLASMSLAVVFGIGAGVIAATSKTKLMDGITMTFSLAGLSLPNFWLAIMLIIVFGIQLRWVSVTGGEGLKNLILPAICLALAPAAVLARLTRSTILEVIHEDYIRTARAKGLKEFVITNRHMVRNAMIPVVTVLGMQFGSMLGGAVFIENVFARSGLGRFAVSAIAARDYPQIQGIVLFTAAIYVLVNLGVDLLYGWLDPRIRLE